MAPFHYVFVATAKWKKPCAPVCCSKIPSFHRAPFVATDENDGIRNFRRAVFAPRPNRGPCHLARAGLCLSAATVTALLHQLLLFECLGEPPHSRISVRSSTVLLASSIDTATTVGTACPRVSTRRGWNAPRSSKLRGANSGPLQLVKPAQRNVSVD